MTDKIILFSYDKPTDLIYYLNAAPGVWFLNLSPGVNLVVADDHSQPAYYPYENDVVYQIFSCKAGSVDLAQVFSLEDCKSVDASFFFDGATNNLYLHLADFEPPLGKTLLFGVGVGYANRATDENLSYYNDFHYAERIKSVQSIKKSIDPLFFGVLKYQGGKITLDNADGEFDDWRSRNLYGQATRILIGDSGADYSAFTRVHSGFIDNDSRDFNALQVNVLDPRKALTQPVARNNFTKAEYPLLSNDDIDKVKPVIYGSVKNAKVTCVNPDITSGTFQYVFMDTEFNQASSISVYVDGAAASPAAVVDLAAGSFTLTFSQADGKTVTCDVVTPIQNGVDIIKDLMYRYDGKNYLASFWDLTETWAAQFHARNTSLYIDNKDKKLFTALESVCFDIDARFFAHDDGKYTVRLYDENRTPTRTIEADEWLNDAAFDNNSSEYLTSAVIKFNKDISKSTFQQVEYTDYQAAAYARYKKYNIGTFETNLTSEIDAIEKADTVMKFSSNIQDTISRSIPIIDNTLEICDFVICDPTVRPLATEARAVYEILGIEKNLEKEELKLTLRYVKPDPTINYVFDSLVDVSGNFIVDVDGNTILTITEA